MLLRTYLRAKRLLQMVAGPVAFPGIAEACVAERDAKLQDTSQG